MKKWMFIVLGIVCVIGAILLAWPKVNMKSVENMEFRFIYGDINSVNLLEPDEVETIKGIFQGKWIPLEIIPSIPSCGFDENIAIETDSGQTFCIACDGCPTVLWKEKNMYIELTEEEHSILVEILEKYGFFEGCV